MKEVKVYETDTAIVRVHPGKLTDEELRKVLEDASRQFYKAICRKGKEHLVHGVYQ